MIYFKFEEFYDLLLDLREDKRIKKVEEKRDQMRGEIIRRKMIEEREKIINRSAIVSVLICTVTVAIVHKYTILHPLMWVFFGPKCVKRLHFSILQKFTQSDVIALIKDGKL